MNSAAVSFLLLAAVHVILLVQAYAQRLFSYKLRQLYCNVTTALYYMPEETDLSGPEEGSQYQHFPHNKNRLQEQKSLSEPAHEARTASNPSSRSAETGCVLSTCRPPPPRSASWSPPPTPECSPCAACRPRSPPGYLQHKPPQTRPQDHEIRTID